jgi:phosphate transport system permease protein
MAFGVFWLAWILFDVLRLGLGGLSLDLFTKMTPPPGGDGGLLNAIAGSLIMVTLAMLIGTPIGILAGFIWPNTGSGGWLGNTTRLINDILLSAPSIVLGLFVYALVVARMGGFSGFAGVMALALIVDPVVVRTTENMLMLVPNTLREAAFALGRSQVARDERITCARRRPACSPACCWRWRASPARPRRCFSRRSPTSSGRSTSRRRWRTCRSRSSSSP